MVKIDPTMLYAVLLALSVASAVPHDASSGKPRIRARNAIGLAAKGNDDQGSSKSLGRLRSISPVPFRKSSGKSGEPPPAPAPVGKGLKHYQDEAKRLYPESAHKPSPETANHSQSQQSHSEREKMMTEEEKRGRYQKQRLNSPFEKHENKGHAAREKIHPSPAIRKDTARSENDWQRANAESDAKQKAMDKQRQWNREHRLPRSDNSFKQQELLKDVAKTQPKVRFDDGKNTVIAS